MTDLLIALSVAEAAMLVVALAVSLVLVARRLRSIASKLEEVAGAAAHFEGRAEDIRAGVGRLNWALEKLARELPDAADAAEALARRR